MSELNPAETPPKKRKVKVLKPSQILKKERNVFPFEGRFLESFGKPEKHAKWFITGPSFAGKSSLLFELAAYMCGFTRVDINEMEEAGGDSETVAQKIRQSKMPDGNIRMYKAPLISDVSQTLYERMTLRNSPGFVVINSMQHAEMDKKLFLHYTDTFCNPRRAKSMCFISHWIKNDLTKFVKHDCDIKIEVIGYVAHVESRYGGGKPFIIWEQGAKNYWKKKYHRVINGWYWPGKKM
jgi:hypothetical protein